MDHRLIELREILKRTTAEVVDDPEDILSDLSEGAPEFVAALDLLAFNWDEIQRAMKDPPGYAAQRLVVKFAEWIGRRWDGDGDLDEGHARELAHGWLVAQSQAPGCHGE